MKVSAYQFICLSGPIVIEEGKIDIIVVEYASTRDCAVFEQTRPPGFGSKLKLIIKIDVPGDGTAVYPVENEDKNTEPGMVWMANGRIYAGCTLLGYEHPAIVEIIPDAKWVRLFYSSDFTAMHLLLKSYRNKLDFEMQQSILIAQHKLNMNIMSAKMYGMTDSDAFSSIY